MADVDLSGLGLRGGIVVLAILMVWFMLGDRELYPLWTIGMIAAIGLIAAVSFFRYVTD